MKVAVTGGHITPALAVIGKLKKDTEVVFFGRKNVFEKDDRPSYEYAEITRRKIKFIEVKSGRLQRKLSVHTFPSLARVPNGLKKAYKDLKREKPDVVVCFGGYVGLTVALSAKALGIPVVIHEQTLKTGLSNKIISKFAAKVCISWAQSRKYFSKDKTVLTGNPLREEFIEIKQKKPLKHRFPFLYITGGSAGSHELNLLVEKSLTTLLKKCVIVHQTGDAKEFDDFRRLSEIRETLSDEQKERYVITKFTTANDAARLMHDASLVISRSGINSITEFIYLEKKAYLVPLMHGQKGEQLTNAKFFVSLGLGKIHKEGGNFAAESLAMLNERHSLNDKSLLQSIKNASQKIADTIYEIEQSAQT